MPVRLFVGNLPYDATEEDIRTHFATAGSVL
jgi:RNA recognition motif-containing protein